MTTFIDPDRIAAGRRAKVEEVLDSSAAMDDALTSVKGSVKGYETSFRRFLKGLLAVPETDGLTYESLANEMLDENNQAKADGLLPPHRYTSAGSLSTLESVGRLSAMGDLPDGYVWRRPKQSAPLFPNEKSITDIIWKITNPGAKTSDTLQRWAKSTGVDPTTLYGKRVVTQAISGSSDVEQAVQKLNDALMAINEACSITFAAEQAAATGLKPTDDRWNEALTRIEVAVTELGRLKGRPSGSIAAEARILQIGIDLNKIINTTLA